jgi:POT family proton-dependent oligopeptide transporter
MSGNTVEYSARIEESTVTSASTEAPTTHGSHHDRSGLGGHPAGMTTLFFTEMWERFSYYGMRAILMLYMVAPVASGGLAISTRQAGTIYGVYTMMVYMTSIPGGIIADRILGARRSVLVGGIIIALGHFALAIKDLPFFYGGLILIVLGTGLLKPNISTMLGGLYDKNDERRDSGFSIFYMGINIGAAMAPLVCGYFAQSEQFKALLIRCNIDVNSCWHFGFAAAGIGMLLGLTQYVVHGNRLKSVGGKPGKTQGGRINEVNKHGFDSAQSPQSALSANSTQSPQSDQGDRPYATSQSSPLTIEEWRRLGAIGVLFFFSMLFWAVYEQGGSSLNLFADRLTRNEIFGMSFPSSWLQTIPAVYCIVLAPVFSAFWIKLGDKQPSSPAKFTYGLLFLALGIGLMVPAAMVATGGKVSPLWLVFAYLLMVIGEMCLSPVGLSTVTKLAPARLCSSIMGLWFLSMAFGNLLAGWLSGFFDEKALNTLMILFGSMGVAGLLATVILAALTPLVRRLMGTIR